MGTIAQSDFWSVSEINVEEQIPVVSGSSSERKRQEVWIEEFTKWHHVNIIRYSRVIVYVAHYYR